MSVKGKIVIVDDDFLVTSALKTLLSIEEFDDVVFFNFPNDAISYLEQNEAKVIISDFMMPEMNGFEFLQKAKEFCPNSSMILLTGYADKENAIKAINEIGLYKYIEKPWDNDDLVINIKNAIERSDLIHELNLKIKELEKYSHSLEDIVAQKTADLVKSYSKISAIIDNCADSILTFDKDGIVKNANPAAENMWGLSEEIFENKSIFDLFYTTLNENPLKSIKKAEQTFVKDLFVYNQLSGKKTPVELSVAPVFGKNNELTGYYVAVIRDVSVQKDLDRLRDDFIATLTHDLRTPLLAAIQTLQYFIEGALGELNPRQKVLLETMKTSNNDMLGLVNALLEVYKYESGKLTLVKTTFNLSELIISCVNELIPLAQKKNIAVVFDEKNNKDFDINADRNEIRRVLMNLVGNAINYVNDGCQVKIILSQNNEDLIVCIEDNGPGIPKSDIPKIFKRFSQGTSMKRSTGTGLGLYLSRQIVEAHNGKIWVESDKNKGCAFSFMLRNCIKVKV